MLVSPEMRKRFLVCAAVFMTLAILFVLFFDRSEQLSEPTHAPPVLTTSSTVNGAQSSEPRLQVQSTKKKRFGASSKISLKTANSITALHRGRLQLSPILIDTLQLSPVELEEIELALRENYELTKEIEASLVDTGFDDAGYTVWKVPPYEEDAKVIRDELNAKLVSILGDERGEFMSIAASTDDHFLNRGKGELSIRFKDTPYSGPVLAINLLGRGSELEMRSFEMAAEQPYVLNLVWDTYGHLIGNVEEIHENFEKMKAVSTWTYPEPE